MAIDMSEFSENVKPIKTSHASFIDLKLIVPLSEAYSTTPTKNGINVLVLLRPKPT